LIHRQALDFFALPQFPLDSCRRKGLSEGTDSDSSKGLSGRYPQWLPGSMSMGFRTPSTPSENTATKPNRRVGQRQHLRLKADVTLPGDLTIVGHTLDISSGGLSLEVTYPLELGQRCEIELDLSKMGGPRWVQVLGEVRHCSQSDEHRFRIGLQFVEVADRIKEVLDQYIWSRLTPGSIQRPAPIDVAAITPPPRHKSS